MNEWMFTLDHCHCGNPPLQYVKRFQTENNPPEWQDPLPVRISQTRVVIDKKLSYRWQTARRVYRSVKVTNHGSIPCVRYSFLLVCYNNFVGKTSCAVFEIFEFKIAVTLKTGLGVREGHWKCHYSIRAYDFLLMFCSNYGSISCRFWDIQCRNISRPWNSSQGSLKVIESSTIW